MGKISGVKLIWKETIETQTIGLVVLEVREILALEKCTKQHVLNVILNVRYHSNLQKENLFIAKNAIVNINQKDFSYLLLQ